jgi:hypothetical protein
MMNTTPLLLNIADFESMTIEERRYTRLITPRPLRAAKKALEILLLFTGSILCCHYRSRAFGSAGNIMIRILDSHVKPRHQSAASPCARYLVINMAST